MKTDEIFYHLPTSAIAQAPMEPREDAKLFVYTRKNGKRQHLHVRDIPRLLQSSDVLVRNTTSVLKARLHGVLERTGKTHELFLLREHTEYTNTTWELLLKGRGTVGDTFLLPENVTLTLQAAVDDAWVGGASLSPDAFHAYLIKYGEVPTPPYIEKTVNAAAYETVYANPYERRSVAAPTAGFHLTTQLLHDVTAKGVVMEDVVLDVGRGTFQPVRAKTLEEHVMHAERVHINADVAERISHAAQAGRRIVSVGTTTLRTLEAAATARDSAQPLNGETALFILPGYEFRIVDALLTNFHLPKSTLLALVAAFIGSVDITIDLYNEAIEQGYRFYSFGDAMFIE